MLISSGRTPSSLTLDLLKSIGVVKPGDNHLPYNSSHSVTVPGAAAAWCDTVEQFGSGKVMCVYSVIHPCSPLYTLHSTDSNNNAITSIILL